MLRDPRKNPVQGDRWAFADYEVTVAAVSDNEVVVWADLPSEFKVFPRLGPVEDTFEARSECWTFIEPSAQGFDAWWESLPALLTADNRKLVRQAFEAGELRAIIRTARLDTEPMEQDLYEVFKADLQQLRRERDKLMDMSEEWLESAAVASQTGETAHERGYMRLHAIYVRACNDLTAYICGREPKSEERRADARRWNAFLNCARIRILGWAGLDDALKVRQDRQFTVHFGAEFWTRFLFPGDADAKAEHKAEAERSNAVARKVIVAFADAAVVIEDEARGLRP